MIKDEIILVAVATDIIGTADTVANPKSIKIIKIIATTSNYTNN